MHNLFWAGVNFWIKHFILIFFFINYRLNNFQFTSETFTKNFDLDNIILQINELNFEAGEVLICQRTEQGAMFQVYKFSVKFYQIYIILLSYKIHKQKF